MSLPTSGQISFSQINSALRITNGNLGIGTTAPSVKLDVNGTIKGINYTGANVSLSGQVLSTGVSVTGGIAATGNLTNGGTDFVLGNFDQINRGNSGISRAIVKDMGNKLVLNYTNDFTGGVEIGSSLKVTDNITIQGGNSYTRHVLTDPSGMLELGMAPSNSDNNASYLWDWRSKDLTIGTNNTEIIRITSSGNIGIGSTSPSEQLDVRGNLRVGNSTQSNYITFYGLSGDGPGTWNHSYIGERLYAGSDFSELLLFKGNDPSSDRIRFLAPEIDFDNYTAAVSGTFDGVSTYGSTQMSITTSGSICIGTTRTSAKLNVGGGIDLDGSSSIRGFGTGSGPLIIDPLFTSNNYIQMFDEVRLGVSATNTRLRETTATMGGILISRDQTTISADNQPVLRMDRNGGTGWFDFEITMPNTSELSFRGGADGTGASLTEYMRIGTSRIYGTNLMLANAITTSSMLVSGFTSRTFASYGYFNPFGNFGTAGGGASEYSVYATARVACTELNAYSDQRIKTNIIDINDSSALETIRQIQPKRYNYIDTVTKGEKPVWGFIAQQVASVLDYSVNKVNEYVPNIYNKASVTHDIDGAGSILTLESGTTNVLDITKAVDQKIQIKVYIDDDECVKEVYVKEIINATQIKIEENLDISINEVFVYGQKVNDFHALNKDAIFTVSVGALQELDRQLQDAINIDISHQTTIDTLEQQIQSIMTTLNV